MPDPGDVDPYFNSSGKLFKLHRTYKVYRQWLYLSRTGDERPGCYWDLLRSVVSPDSHNGSVRGPRDIRYRPSLLFSPLLDYILFAMWVESLVILLVISALFVWTHSHMHYYYHCYDLIHCKGLSPRRLNSHLTDWNESLSPI